MSWQRSITDAERGATTCTHCQAVLLTEEVRHHLHVCPRCGCHLRVSAAERVAQLIDAGTFEERHADLRPADPLRFDDGKPYLDRIRAEQERTGLQEAAVVGEGLIQGLPVVLGLVDSGFLMGSMGSVVGEKLTRAIEEATRRKLPLVLVTSSAGARMHEGVLSLMQMAKVAAALARHRAAGGFSLGVLTDPSIGGVAGFAFLGDVVLAEPRAMVGLIGHRVLTRFTHIRIPDGVQTSEFALQHGFIDLIVPRRELRERIAQLLGYATDAS
jgi:acetyl-CoA carboxylase carboxyl transferase subunit beta